MPNYDAIVIPGGGLRPGGELPEHAKRRFDLALALESGEPFVALSAGTAHLPANLDSDRRLLPESMAGARYLVEHHIDSNRIFCESTSYDTIGNAYFSRVQIIEPMGWRRLLIITSQFHMPRTEAIFRWIYSLNAPAPYHLEFAESPDDGLTEAALTARRKREAASLHSVEKLRERLTSLQVLAEWLFTRHDAYRSVRDPLPPMAGDLLETY
jgi:hypothetical protein